MACGRVSTLGKCAALAAALLAPLPAHALHDELTNDILRMIHEDAQLRPNAGKAITQVTNVTSPSPAALLPAAPMQPVSTMQLPALAPAAGTAMSPEPPVPPSIPPTPTLRNVAVLSAPGGVTAGRIPENLSVQIRGDAPANQGFLIAAISISLQVVALAIIIRLLSAAHRRRARAYMFVTDASIAAAAKDGNFIPQEGNGKPSIIRTGDRVAAKMTFTNTGQTPAFHVTVEGNIKMLEWPIDESLLLSEKKKEKAAENIGAADKRSKLYLLNRDRETVSLTPADIENLRNGKSAIWVYGAIKYRDIFQRPQVTRYRYFIGGPAGVRSLDLTAHEKGNDAA